MTDETTSEQLAELEGQTSTVCSDFDADCATMPLADVKKCMRGVEGVIGEQAVALAPINGVCTELQRRQTTSEQSTTLDEPAWVTRFAKGNADCSPFVAKDIADQVREMLVYKRAMESMAKQLIHPKMTALELAELQLRGSDTL